MYSPTMTAPQPTSPSFGPPTPSTSAATVEIGSRLGSATASSNSVLRHHHQKYRNDSSAGGPGYFPAMSTPSVERNGFDFASAVGTKRRTPPSSSSSTGTASQDYFGASTSSTTSDTLHALSRAHSQNGSSTPLSPYKHFRPSPAIPSSQPDDEQRQQQYQFGLAALNAYSAAPQVTSPSSFVFPPISSPLVSGSKSANAPLPKLSLPPIASASGSRSIRSMSAASAPGGSTSAVASSGGSSTARYAALSAPETAELVARSPDSTLVLDIRPRSSWAMARVRGSVNISIPSTLMRRATHTIDRVQDSLSEEEQAIFETWPYKQTIIALDGDSTALLEGSPVASLLSKLAKASFGGRLAWVTGGFNSLLEHVRSSQVPLLEFGQSDPSTPGSTSSGSRPSMSRETSGSSVSSSSRPVLSVRDLPQSAFQQSSTSSYAHSSEPASVKSDNSSIPPIPLRKRESSTASQPMRLSLSSSSGSGNGSEQGSRRVATNPFFDNIRQNAEYLSLDRSMDNLQPVELPHVDEAHKRSLPHCLSSLLDLTPEQRAKKLAREFYELEVTERNRLEGAFKWQASAASEPSDRNATATPSTEKYAKFGISAGFELGNLNRFKNIFPYEHTRVKLAKRTTATTDYINASRIDFASSPKRFIASQGPLKATFDDFWQMIDQEQCGVIVMLTNLQEGGREKCARYWMPGPSSTWSIESTFDKTGQVEEDDSGSRANPGDYFATAKADPTAESSENLIRRTIRAKRRTDAGPATARKVRHLHYRAWPDFDLPASPDDIVKLVREVDAAQQEYMREIGWTDHEREPPIVAHCSAGVGRTGVFIMVSTLLDKLRRDRRAASASNGNGNDLDVMMRDERQRSISSSSTSDTASLTAGFEAQTLRSQTGSPVPPQISVSDDGHAMPTFDRSASEDLSRRSNASERAARVVPLERDEPIFAAANEMREARMSMIANYRQYVCVHECVLLGALQDIDADADTDTHFGP